MSIFDQIGFEPSQLFTLLFLGLGPVRICLSWLTFAQNLNRRERFRVAWRITWVSMVLVAGIMMLGFVTVKNVAPQKEWLGIGAAVVLMVSALSHRAPELGISDQNAYEQAMKMAIHPLAVPIMINSGGLGILLIASAYVRDVGAYSTFFGVVILIFFVNFGLMLFLGRFTRALPVALINLLGEIFAILLVSLSVYYIFRSLNNLGIVNFNM